MKRIPHPEDIGPYGYASINLTKEEYEAQRKVPSKIAFINGAKIELSEAIKLNDDWIGRALMSDSTEFLPKVSRWDRLKMWCRNFYYRYLYRGA